MEQEQITLFDFMAEQEKDPITNSTCIIIDGKCTNITWKELFNAEEYDSLDCVTYVSSGDFFSKSIAGFKKIRLVIGIEKPEIQDAIYQSIMDHLDDKALHFFNELVDDDKDKLLNGELAIRFPMVNCIIHSKFYLLWNSITGNTRLIIGSANLTNTAFDNKFNQFEDIIVYDNSPLFEIYKDRFNYIFDHTTDFISQDICEKYREGKLVSFIDLSAEDKTEDIINRLRQENIVPVCNEAVLEMLEVKRKEEEVKAEKARATFEIIAGVTKKKKGENQLVLKNESEIAAAMPKLIDILFKQTKEEHNLRRFSLTYNDANKSQYRVFIDSDNGSEKEAEKYDRFATNEEIRKAIQNIIKFTEAYHIFSADNDKSKKNLSRVLEAIIYAFMSVYVFKLRQDTSGSKADIPIMLVIGGRAASGKSNLLAFIDRLLSGRRLEYGQHFIQYKHINKGNAIGDLFASDNTYPLLVDEVAPNFFSSQSGNKGEELIKYLSNTLDSKHPVMICTTNTGAFNIPAQVARRIYFLKVDSCFNPKMKTEANEYYDFVMNSADNILFRDFCARIGERISTGDSLFSDNSADFLGIARQIFSEYFKICDFELPDYFPHDVYSDYEARGTELWKTLYRNNKKSFRYTKKKNGHDATLTINIKDLTSGNRDAQVYMNYLRQDILVEEAGLYVVLKASEFYKWIDEKKPIFK